MNKHLLSIFLLTLFLASFLASCGPGTNTLTSTTDTIAPTLTCPDGSVALTIPAGAENLTLTNALTGVTSTDDSSDTPILTYQPAVVTIMTTAVTATAIDATGNEATCTFDVTVTDDGGDTLTLENCPADQADAVANVPVQWINPSDSDFTITAIVIVTTGDTVNDALPTLTPTSTLAILSEGTYTITITAASTADATVTDTCSFDVTVGPTVFTANCPTTPVPIALTIAGDDITLADDPSVMVTTENASGEVTFAYEPSTITVDHVDTSLTVTATAMDTVEGANEAAATSTCTFTVEVTKNVGSSIYTDTTISCNPTTTSATLTADGAPIDLTQVLASDSGITATNAGIAIDSPNFVYTPSSLPTANTYMIMVTVLDSAGTIALSGNAEAFCEFSFTVEPAPDPSFSVCPTGPINGVINEPVTWDEPMLMNHPALSSISEPLITPEGATSTTSTGATFTAIDTYTVTFTAITSDSTAIIVSGSPLICTFEITVDALSRPTNSAFFLATHIDPPGPDNPFLIQDTNDLKLLAMAVNSDQMYTDINNTNGSYRTAAYRLENNISFDTTIDNNFTPIGTGMALSNANGIVTTCETTCFQGTFDGGNKTISGLRFSNNDDNNNASTNIGLFAVISDASISNLILTDANITAVANIGGLVGAMLSSSHISNASVSATITGSTTLGGLVGDMHTSTITNASAVDINISTTGVGGGLVGIMNTAKITNAFASGTIAGSIALGGLVGSVTSNSSITNAYASADVESRGGIVGGLVGNLEGLSSLTNTLAWGNIAALANLGGLVGTLATSSTSTTSYWDSTVNPLSTTIMSDGNEKPTTELQIEGGPNTIYATWNTIPDLDIDGMPGSDTPWIFSATDYPRLNGLLITVACQRDSSHTSCPQ